MLKTIILFFLLLSNIFFSQELKFEEIVKVDSTITKEELYNRARSWIVKTFKSESYITTVDDKGSGEVTGSGRIRYDPNFMYFGALCAKGYIYYRVNIYIKEGRYKYIFNSFTHEGTKCSNGGSVTSYGLLTEDKKSENGPRKGWEEIKELTNTTMPKIIGSLKEAMSSKYEVSKDW